MNFTLTIESQRHWRIHATRSKSIVAFCSIEQDRVKVFLLRLELSCKPFVSVSIQNEGMNCIEVVLFESATAGCLTPRPYSFHYKANTWASPRQLLWLHMLKILFSRSIFVLSVVACLYDCEPEAEEEGVIGDTALWSGCLAIAPLPLRRTDCTNRRFSS